MQNLLSSTLLSKNKRIQIYRTITLPVVLCVCENWSFTVREERGLRVFESMVLRTIFGSKKDEVQGSGENYIMRRSLMICNRHRILLLLYYSRRMRWAGSVARMEDRRVVYMILAGKLDGKETTLKTQA